MSDGSGARRLKIAFVSDTLSGWVGGGVVAARQVVDRLRELHDVIPIGVDAEGAGKLPGFQLPVRAMKAMYFMMARPHRPTIAKVIEACDVVHLQFPFWLSHVALAEARALGKPVVAAFHVQPENALLNVGVRSPWLVRSVYRWWVRSIFNQADAVICPTHFAERKLRAHGLTAPAFVVSNGVPPDVTPIAPAREPQHDGAFLVLMVGRLAAEKRQDVLLRALGKMKHADRVRVVIAGAGPRDRAVRKLAAPFGDRVEIGFLPRERLLRLLASADLMVHASEVELEGLAVLEAMSMGCPVLVAQSDESAASEFALDARFAFPAGDADALAQRIDALIESPTALAEARVRYRDAAGALDFAASVRQLVEVYDAVTRAPIGA